jgi:hypothetical protein
MSNGFTFAAGGLADVMKSKNVEPLHPDINLILLKNSKPSMNITIFMTIIV